MTEFKVVRTHDSEGAAAISEPLLASFPANVPPALGKMRFSVYQQEARKGPKRVVKAEYKGLKYEAKATKDQASDYYLALFDPSKNTAYAMKVGSALQFGQVIAPFEEALDTGDNDALKQMSYMDKKKQLVEAFGTKKSIKKVTSMLTNMVDEGGITNAPNRGVRDARLATRAEGIEEGQAELRKDVASRDTERQQLYTRERLLPSELMALIPYKKTHEALTNGDSETLQGLLVNTLVRNQLERFFAGRFQALASGSEKKLALRAFIYLDCLVSLQRMPMHIELSVEDLTTRLKTIP